MQRSPVAAVLVSMTLCGALSCGRGASAPSGSDSKATRALLGDDTDYAVVVHVDRFATDPVYGPLIREHSDLHLDKYLARVTAIDMVGALDGPKPTQSSFVITVRGAGPTEDLPDEWQRALSGKDGAHPLPSGVLEYATVASDGWPYGGYIAPRDWVLLAGRAAGRGHDYFATHTAPPPPVDFGDDSLIGIWIGPTAIRRAAMAEEAKEPGSLGLESARLVLRDGTHGDLIYDATYDSSEHAQSAIKETREQVGMYASVWKQWVDKCPGIGALTLEASLDGRSVHARVAHIPEAIRAGIACAGTKT
ncbi:MAG: hypothetical protein NVSMB47_21670 [Polyangiales bacterium]